MSKRRLAHLGEAACHHMCVAHMHGSCNAVTEHRLGGATLNQNFSHPLAARTRRQVHLASYRYVALRFHLHNLKCTTTPPRTQRYRRDSAHHHATHRDPNIAAVQPGTSSTRARPAPRATGVKARQGHTFAPGRTLPLLLCVQLPGLEWLTLPAAVLLPRVKMSVSCPGSTPQLKFRPHGHNGRPSTRLRPRVPSAYTPCRGQRCPPFRSAPAPSPPARWPSPACWPPPPTLPGGCDGRRRSAAPRRRWPAAPAPGGASGGEQGAATVTRRRSRRRVLLLLLLSGGFPTAAARCKRCKES